MNVYANYVIYTCTTAILTILFQAAEVIATYNHSVGHPYGMVHHSTMESVMFYWTEFKEGRIRSYNTLTKQTVILRNESIPLYEIRLFDNEAQTGRHNSYDPSYC